MTANDMMTLRALLDQAQGVKFGRRSPLNRGQHCTPFHTEFTETYCNSTL